MVGSFVGPFSKIRYELWADGLLNTVLQNQSGLSFTYLFGTGVAEGNCFVRFYADKNGNGARDSGEPYRDSAEFWVMQKRVFNLKVDVSDAIPNAEAFAAQAAMQARFDTARNLLLKKDSAADYRAAVQFNVSLVTSPDFPDLPPGVFSHTDSAGARPDPVTNPDNDNKADVTKHWDADADVVFVNQLGGNAGYSDYDWRRTVVARDSPGHFVDGAFSELRLAGTIAHELGHGVGLNHPSPDDPNRVMTVSWAGTFNHLTATEAGIFDGGRRPLILQESPMDGELGAATLTEGELALIFQDAGDRLFGSAKDPLRLRAVKLEIADLPGSLLGLTSGNTIWIDQNAAGHGWFIDASPLADSEFPMRSGEHELQALPGSPAYGKADLLTVLFHELGHVMGLEHGADHEVMAPTLPLGVRRLPEPGETQLPAPREDVGKNSRASTLAPDERISTQFVNAPLPIDALILPRFWGALVPISTVCEPTRLLEEKTAIAPARNVRDFVFTEMGRPPVCLDPSKNDEPLERLSVAGLFEKEFPWNE